MSGPLAVRGVVEGFYGAPWSWEDRHRVVRFLAANDANTYVYAPKNDPLHRDRWREPYLDEEWERFADLARAGDELGVDLWFGLSPLGIRVTDPEDLACLESKLAAADDAGLRRICLLVDDMPEDFESAEDAERFPTLAAAHAHLVAIVRRSMQARGPDRRLWFVPLHYHGEPGQAYGQEIGASIDPDVAIMWTGPEVCSERLTLEHTRAVAEDLRRPVLYWDNHPVNDGAMRFDPHLNPLRARDPRLGDHAMGLLANVAIEPEASLIAVGTAMRYAADPAGYDDADAWPRALEDVTGNAEDARAVAVLADLARRSPLQRGDPYANQLTAHLERCTDGWAEPDADRRRRLSDVAEVLTQLEDAAARLQALGNERLRDDLRPWSDKLALQSAAASASVRILANALESGATPTEERRGVVDMLEGLRTTFHWVAGDQLEMFARWCLREAARWSADAAAGEGAR